MYFDWSLIETALAILELKILCSKIHFLFFIFSFFDPFLFRFVMFFVSFFFVLCFCVISDMDKFDLVMRIRQPGR